MKRTVAVLIAMLAASVVHAQRFEGVITMHMNSSRGRAGGAMTDSAALGRGGARGAMPDSAARGGVNGRGAQGDDNARGARGDSTGRGARADANGRAGRGGPPGIPGAMGNARAQFAMPSDIEYMTRRGKVRISLGGTGASAPGAMIYLPDDGLVYTIFPAASMYMQSSTAELTMPINAYSDSVRATRRSVIAQTPVVTHTKQFELIAGHRCEHITVLVGKEKTDICMAKGLGAFVMPNVMGQNQAWQTATDAANGFPMKVVQSDGTVMMEVTKVERKALAESLFSVPDSYSRMPDAIRKPPGL